MYPIFIVIPLTMGEAYGDDEDYHLRCPKCGCCLTCRDCKH